MRAQSLMVSCVIAAMSACERHDDSHANASNPGLGIRRAGLWRQTVLQDGRPTPFGTMRVCVNQAVDERMTMIGRAVGGARCTQSINKQSDGSIRFHSICSFGRAGAVDSTGRVSSNFLSAYHLHADSAVRGSIYRPMNGVHATDVTANYVGSCPSGMAPGEIIIGPGLKVNLDRLPIAGAAAALG